MAEAERIVTTTYRTNDEVEAKAKEAARRLDAVYVKRGRSSLRRLGARHPRSSFLVVGEASLEWYPEGGGEPFFFHPSMSLIRAKRLAEGESDPMLEAAGFAPGDSVVDCTAGLGSDAIVFSFAGGPDSRIYAVESELPLHFIVSNGLLAHESGWPEFDEALRRIQPIHADHAAYLRTLADRSVDVVYFDPMFRSAVHASSGISPLRAFANVSPLSEEAVHEAVRVARKAVVLKERGRAEVWNRLGFTLLSKPQAPVAYGVIRI